LFLFISHARSSLVYLRFLSIDSPDKKPKASRKATESESPWKKEAEDQAELASSLVSISTTISGDGPRRFPERLYELLSTEAAPKSLYWLPGGKAFAIEQENVSAVLDKYFQATKFASFIRRLHKW